MTKVSLKGGFIMVALLWSGAVMCADMWVALLWSGAVM